MLPVPAATESKKSGLAYWAARVLDECDKAAVNFAADPVHDLRVAIRRCRSMADGFHSVDPDPAWKQMKRLAKPLFSALGDLRDTQVMLEWVAKLSPADDALGAELSAALRAKEDALKKAAQQALANFDRDRWSTLMAHLAARTGAVPVEGAVFQHLALERWLEARELHRRALRNRSSLAWHQLRIGIKRLRYTAENFLPQRHQKWSKDLRELQDALGEVHDLDVLRAIVSRHPGAPADERSHWVKRIAEERHKRLQLYRSKMTGRHSLWELWRNELPSGIALEDAALEKLRTWAAFLDPDVTHSALVNRLSLELYDGLSQCGILKLTPHHRHILEAAAWLHEVGRSKSGHKQEKNHRKRGQRLVIKLKPPLGWTEQDMQSLAALVRFHRGRLPSRGDSLFVGLDRRQRADLLRLMGILRLANSFDDAHDGRLRELAVTRKDGAVVVRGQGLQAMSGAAERVACARYLLETACGRPILIQIQRARTARKERSDPAVQTGRSRLLNR